MTVLKIVVEVHYIIISDYSWIYNMQIASCELVFKNKTLRDMSWNMRVPS